MKKKTNPQRAPTSSGIVESPTTKNTPPATQAARAQRSLLLNARLRRELTRGPAGLASNDNANTGGVAEGGGATPYTLA